MNHGRMLLPAHLTGRGVSLINLFSIGGVGVSQIVSARAFAGTMQHNADIFAAYKMVLGLFVVSLAVGCLIYLLSKEQDT